MKICRKYRYKYMNQGISNNPELPKPEEIN